MLIMLLTLHREIFIGLFPRLIISLGNSHIISTLTVLISLLIF